MRAFQFNILYYLQIFLKFVKVTIQIKYKQYATLTMVVYLALYISCNVVAILKWVWNLRG